MRIKIEKPLISEQGAMVQVHHGLNDGGRTETVFFTNDVIFIEIEGAGRYEVDLTREDPSLRLVKQHKRDGVADGNSRR